MLEKAFTDANETISSMNAFTSICRSKTTPAKKSRLAVKQRGLEIDRWVDRLSKDTSVLVAARDSMWKTIEGTESPGFLDEGSAGNPAESLRRKQDKAIRKTIKMAQNVLSTVRRAKKSLFL